MSELTRLAFGQPCCVSVSWERACGHAAHWLVRDPDGDAPDVAICDEHIKGMADMNSDNETFLQPALADIRAREQR